MHKLLKCAILFIFVFDLAISMAPFSYLLPEFNAFKVRYRKSYATPMLEARAFRNFIKNKIKIDKHNLLFENGDVIYELSVNRFSDLSPTELANIG